tara:strand:- start:350 stop:487 length:138 start_codon:yes stop_codon:yes gene_type:complete
MKCPECEDGKLKLDVYKNVTYVYSKVRKQYAKMTCDNCGHTEYFN